MPVDLVRHPQNAGKGVRLSEGIARAVAGGADAVLSMDADGQHLPGDIPAFLDACRGNPQALVLGDRSTVHEKKL